MNETGAVDFAKAITRIVVSIGASKIAGAIIAEAVNPETITEKVTIYATSYVLGSMVASAASKHSDKMIDDVVKTYKKFNAKIKSIKS